MSSNPALLIEKRKTNATQVEALTLLWQSLLPIETLPPYQQIILWLCRFGFEKVESAVEKTATKFLRVNGTMNADYCHRYTSSVLASASRESEDNNGNRR